MIKDYNYNALKQHVMITTVSDGIDDLKGPHPVELNLGEHSRGRPYKIFENNRHAMDDIGAPPFKKQAIGKFPCCKKEIEKNQDGVLGGIRFE